MASKITTVALQIIAMPVAAISLGAHGFALYAMLTAAVGWLTLSNLGIGPTLIVRLAAAHANGRLKEQRNIFSSGFFPTLIISAVVTLSAILATWKIPIENIFGPLYVADVSTIRWGLTTLVVMFFVQTNLSMFESAQAGYQEQYIQNIISTVSSIPCLLGVLILARMDPTPVGLIFALNAPVLIFRCGNAIFIMCRHPPIRPSLKAFRWPICRTLVKGGTIFSLAGGAGNFLAHILPVILVGRAFSSEISAAFAATMNALILASGAISMLSTPLWPAIADSVARGDRDWAQTAYNRLLWSVMIFGLLTAIFLAVKGDWLFQIWFKGQINPGRNLILAMALYFLASCWESAHFTILVGLHKIAAASILVFLRAVLGVGVISMFLDIGSEASVFIIMFVAVAIVDFIPLRMLVLRELSSRMQ